MVLSCTWMRLQTRGEGHAEGADLESYPYYRAVELVFDVLDDCDNADVLALEAEIESLSAEAAELLYQASVAEQVGDEAVESETGSGRLRREGESRWTYFLETWATAMSGVDGEPAEWAGAEMFDMASEARAEALEQEAELLRQQVDELRALAEAVE